MLALCFYSSEKRETSSYYNRVGWMPFYRIIQVLSNYEDLPEEMFPFPTYFKGFPFLPLSCHVPEHAESVSTEAGTVQRRVNMAQVGRIGALRDAGRTGS